MKVRDKVRSPCVSVCALNDDDVCIGCQRTGDEILRWSSMTDEERRQVLKSVAEREKKFQI
ncbi:DUF1289 domain-containing protein [Marinobacter sp. SBS5]|uniref:DUF1289 domain-containing protein n=1 Tax=Marinobacter sp. SBS5 TaxID=3401754 RepID=UPI003AAA2110